MFKKILIISDNLFLCQRFNDIIKSGDFPQQKWTFAVSPFSDAGTFRYHCAIHPDMVGTVVVH